MDSRNLSQYFQAKLSGVSAGTFSPALVEAGVSDRRSSRHSVNMVLLDSIHQLTNTASEVQYLLNEAISSQAQSAQMQREFIDTIRELRSSIYSQRESVYSIGQPPMLTPISPGGIDRRMPHIPETYEQPILQAPAPTAHSTSYEWSVQLGPIDLSQVMDLHGTALSFARMTRRGNQISPQVRGRKGGPHILIMAWKTEEEARAFYKAWTDDPPTNYATLSVIPNF
ncbi:hypothetical protein GYMLUDRAFT_944594 [Collybiopsis luxurians FD-317 M1]|uniref:Uncharacterized protein n=1 Tax=Collybiopsis luxurians FD-317 M1 TaxID=944289 RepID=A0A0D0BTX8_9AGAR|nr:hypothetical protein GYMLUDRAFT_944594 [Collybiopsis luxurians FD-317 M1]